ncbi:MAG: hypothetical protein JNL66_05070 [Alphaproteobacteria bacterium]|nr:hypothetical protein [Alphaproteobacteria bacterium]
MLRIAGAALTLALAAAAAVPANAAGAASGWTEIRLSQSACISTAQRAVSGVGFEASADAQTVYGWRGEMVVVVRCIANRNVAVFFAYETSEAEATALVDRLRPYFAPAPAGK